jgi:hypothetical protein
VPIFESKAFFAINIIPPIITIHHYKYTSPMEWQQQQQQSTA